MGKTFPCILLLVVLLAATSFAAKKPKLVIFHHRHGARQSLYNFGVEPTEPGQLTAVGIRQMYLLGREFRKRYIEEMYLLPKQFNSRLIYARSTQFNRTLLSAQAFWAGFYPEDSGDTFSEKYPFDRAVPPFGGPYNVTSLGRAAMPKGIQPVPIHSSSLEKDYLLQAYDLAACPNRKKLLDTPEIKKIVKEVEEAFQPTFQEVAQVMKLNKTLTFSLMSSVADYLYSNYMLGNPTQIAPDSELWQRFYMTKNISLLLAYYPTRREMNIFTTKLYEDMLYRMDAALNNKTENLFIEFSSHDLTLNLILASLKITSWECLYEKFKKGNYSYDPTCPFTTVVASSIVFELWENDDNKTHSVKLYYNGISYPINGKDPIPYDEFTAYLKSTLVPDFLDQCLGTDELVETVNEPLPKWQIIVVIIQILAVIVLGSLLVKKRMEIAEPTSEKTALSYS